MQNSLTKKLGLTVAAVAMAATGLFTATDAEAVPAFARQTGMTCSSCHFQAFPALNGMGRSFRAGGYTMQGTQTAVQGENINLPSSLNMSGIWKTLYEKGKHHNQAAILWPDEAALLVGGRASESIGFLWEVGLNEDPGTSFLSTKIHFNVVQGDVNFAVIPFSTDALGVAYGFEWMNTAVQRSQRPIEDRRASSMGQKFGIVGTGAATGIALVANTPSWFVNVSLWGPAHGELDGVNLGAMAQWIRAAYFFDLAGFDTGVGFGTKAGSVAIDAGADGDTSGAYNVAVGGTVIDFQMQGQVGGQDLGIYLNQSMGADKGTPSDECADPAAPGNDCTIYSNHTKAAGTGITVKYSATNALQVYLGLASGSNGADVDSSYSRTTVGLQYHWSENTKLEVFNMSETNGAADDGKFVMGWFVGL